MPIFGLRLLASISEIRKRLKEKRKTAESSVVTVGKYLGRGRESLAVVNEGGQILHRWEWDGSADLIDRFIKRYNREADANICVIIGSLPVLREGRIAYGDTYAVTFAARRCDSGVAPTPVLDEIMGRYTAFKTFNELIRNEHGYSPTIHTKGCVEKQILADSYDAAQAERGDPRRVFRGIDS